MSRLTIDISPEQHKSLKAMAALEGKTIRQYALERLFPHRAGGGNVSATLGAPVTRCEAQMDAQDQSAWDHLGALLEERAAAANSGQVSDKPFDQVVEEALQNTANPLPYPSPPSPTPVLRDRRTD